MPLSKVFTRYFFTNSLLDPGSSNPYISVVGTSGNKHFVIDGWTNPHPLISVTVDEILEQIHTFTRKYSPLAKETYCKVPDDRKDIALSSQKYGVTHSIEPMKRCTVITRNNPSPLVRAQLTNTLFHQNRLFLNKNLTELVDDFRSYHRAQNSSGEFIEKIADGQNDHSVDSVLYVIGFLNKKNIT